MSWFKETAWNAVPGRRYYVITLTDVTVGGSGRTVARHVNFGGLDDKAEIEGIGWRAREMAKDLFFLNSGGKATWVDGPPAEKVPVDTKSPEVPG